MGLDLGAIGASVKLNTAPLAAGVVKAKAMFSGLDKSLGAGGLKNSEKGLAGLGSALKNLSGIGGSATNVLGTLGSQIGVLGQVGLVAGAVVGLGAAFYSCAKAAEEDSRILAQTNAVIKSTGGVANVSAGDVEKLGEHLADVSGVSHDVIKSAENIMLTFRGVKNIGSEKIFDQAITSTLDMSIALKKDLSDSAIKVGKALQDPVKGLTALRRYGVMFTDSQVEQAKQMVKNNDLMGAQKMILQELSVEFGGSAAAAGGTLSGQIGVLKDHFDRLKESIGAAILPTFISYLKQVSAVMGPLMKLSEITPFKLIPKLPTGESINGMDSLVSMYTKVWNAMMKVRDMGKMTSIKGFAINIDVTAAELHIAGLEAHLNSVKKTLDEIIAAADKDLKGVAAAAQTLTTALANQGLAGVTTKITGTLLTGLATGAPKVRDAAYDMLKGIIDAEGRANPVIAANAGDIMTSIETQIEQARQLGPVTEKKMAEIINSVLASKGPVSAAMAQVLAAMAASLSGGQGLITAGIQQALAGIRPAIDAAASGMTEGAATIINAIQGYFNSHPVSVLVNQVNVKLSPVRSFSSAAGAGAYIAEELAGGVSAGMANAPAGITLSGGSAMSDLASATALANASFGNFIGAMTAEPLNEVNDAIMRMTANNTSSLGDWWKLRGAYDAATKSLASYEKQIATAEKAVTSLEGKIEKANAARERPSLVMDKESTELQLKIMQAEDAHNYALVNKLNIQKEALDRKKEELDLTTSIADKTKELKDTSAFKGKTTAQIDAMIATWSAALLKKTNQVAALKVTYEKVQVSVDKFKKIIDDLAAYFTSKSPAPAGYASGTSYVPRTGMAMVHQGEQIIPANLNPLTLGSGRDILITVPLYLDSKVLTKAVSRVQGGQANSRAMSGGKY